MALRHRIPTPFATLDRRRVARLRRLDNSTVHSQIITTFITFLSPRSHAIDVPRRYLEIPLVATFCFAIVAEVDGREIGVGFVELGGRTTVVSSGRYLLFVLGGHCRFRTAIEQMP